MKNVKNILSVLITILLVLSSCSKEEEITPVVQKASFVKKIVSNSTSISSANQTIEFNYNALNKISNYSITKSSSTTTHTITYNPFGLVTSIKRVATSGATSVTTTFNFSYNTNGILTQLIIPGTTTTTMNFTYDSVQKKYIGDDGDGFVIEIKLDANDNVKQFVNSMENSNVSYSANSGIFQKNTNSLPLLLTHFFASDGNAKYIAQLFSSKEITVIEGATSTLTATTTRNSNNTIAQIQYNTSSTTAFTAVITYEERVL